jgi:hypothetical protein
MWVRKSDEQVAAGRKRLSLSFGGPIIVFVLGFIMEFGLTIIGEKRPATPVYWPGTWADLVELLPRATVGGTIAGALAAVGLYIWQLVYGRDVLKGNVKTVICNACYRVKRENGESKCQCGGMFEDFDKWTWVDD